MQAHVLAASNIVVVRPAESKMHDILHISTCAENIYEVRGTAHQNMVSNRMTGIQNM